MVKKALRSAPSSSDAMEGLPLFFRRPMPLDAQRHAKAGIVPSRDYAFATGTNSILINAVEFVEAAKHYPIVFTEAALPLPVSVLGLERRNYFVDEEGEWKEGAYVPAYVRRYPFVFMDVPERRQFLLCIDEESPHFRKAGGKGTRSLYDGEELSALTRNALEFCAAFHNHHQSTRQFCEAIMNAGLLVQRRSDVRLAGGREIRLNGFHVIDEKKFNALPDAAILDFHKKGWLPLIYFALMSASHWKKLVDMASALDAGAGR